MKKTAVGSHITILIARDKLLQSLAIPPDPASPHSTYFLPISCNIGLTFSKPSSEPPTINVKVPAVAPATPPLTGQSKKSHPKSSLANLLMFYRDKGLNKLKINRVL